MKIDKALTKVFSEYVNFTAIFLPNLAIELSKYIKINDCAFELVDDWEPPYGSIYSLGPVELEMLKTYIENNLANSFVKTSKSLAEASILFDKKFNMSPTLCINYQGLNNLIIKNWYLLSLVSKSWD